MTPVGGAPRLRRPSDQDPLERVKSIEYADGSRRKSAPDRIRSASVSEEDHGEGGNGNNKIAIFPTPQKRTVESDPFAQRAVDVLIAEDNPISQKVVGRSLG
jgi:hypothetical protein